SFAYKTVKDRMPVIVAKVADSVFRAQSTIKESHGEKGSEDLKTIAGCVSKLRNEMMTNKVLIPIEDSRSDTKTWNAFLTEVTDHTRGTGASMVHQSLAVCGVLHVQAHTGGCREV
ncbi:hypothetical protein DPMN_088219, partial [Dreissena polymorpha]